MGGMRRGQSFAAHRSQIGPAALESVSTKVVRVDEPFEARN